MPRGAIAKRSARVTQIPGGGTTFGATTSDNRVTLAVDSSQAADAYAVLLTQAITLPAALSVDVVVTYAVAVSPASIASLAIFVDGAQRQAACSWTNGATAQQSGAVSWRETLGAGAHTITARWRNVGGAGGGILCRPVTVPNFESCSMRVQALATVTV